MSDTAAATAQGLGSTSWKVHPDGRIGPGGIDVSTDAQIRRVAGKPFKLEKVFSEARKDPVGYELYYWCGRRCVTTYAISYATRRLSDFTTQSPHVTSEDGSHVGMAASRAARAEHSKIVGGCGEGHYIHLRWDEHPWGAQTRAGDWTRSICSENVFMHATR